MSVAYRSWELAGGPILGFNMAIQNNLCINSDTLIPETPNHSSNTSLPHESLIKVVPSGVEVSKSIAFPNHKTLTSQDTVIRGLSSLSLHPQSQLLATSPTEECKVLPSYESSNKSIELNYSAPMASNGSDFYCFATASAEYHMQGKFSGSQKLAHHDGNVFKGFKDVSFGTSALLPHSGSSVTQDSTSPNTFWVTTRNYLPHYSYEGGFAFHGFPKHSLDVVIEDKPFEENLSATGKYDLELDALSASSSNSISSLVDGSVSSGEGLHGVEESEAQSVFKGSSTFAGNSSPPRKGLSRFYAGKSRSFSCLGDALSLKDLAKPENTYAKKRRCHTGRSLNAGRLQRPPLQKGAASISKKAPHSGKSTLALAVTMSTREDGLERKDDQSSLGVQRRPSKCPLSSRSYSLSDLQRATESQVFQLLM